MKIITKIVILMSKQLLIEILAASLKEDIPNQDITSELFLAQNTESTATIIAKENGIFYGEIIINTLLNMVDENAKIHYFKYDGDKINHGEKVCTITSQIKTLLKIERIMLNFIQRLSGISTLTHKFVEKLNNPKIKIVDTRKTTPLFRFLEKEAVKAGGGYNHRQNLSDMVLIKENHLSQLAKENQIEHLNTYLKTFKEHNPNIKIEIEIETLKELESFDFYHVDIIMFDNFSIEDLKKAIQYCKEHNLFQEREVSGNITLDNISNYKNHDIHRIAIGSLTHSVKSIDLSMLVQ